MSNRSEKLLADVAKEIGRKYEDYPCYKLGGNYDVSLSMSLISDIVVWYRGYKNYKPRTE